MVAEKILVIDPERVGRSLLCQNCEEWGYEVLEADFRQSWAAACAASLHSGRWNLTRGDGARFGRRAARFLLEFGHLNRRSL